MSVISLRDLRHLLWSVSLGALLEIIVLLSLVPKDSTEPPTRFQEALGVTQVPGTTAFHLLFGTGLGHLLDKLPSPIGTAFTMIGFVAVFLLQSVVMGLPVWLAIRGWRAIHDRALG